VGCSGVQWGAARCSVLQCVTVCYNVLDERGLPFYYLKIEFLEYPRISGEIRYPNGPID